MNHLGELVSALVDGELTGAERDRATVHLARCEKCRAGAARLRTLKGQLGSLADPPPVTGLEKSLLDLPADPAMALLEDLEPAAGTSTLGAGNGRLRGRPRRARSQQARSQQAPAQQALAQRRARADHGARRAPGGSRGPRRGKLPKRRYMVIGTVSVVVGLGAAAFTMGGGDTSPGPRIVPQVELYGEEHAITTGQVPFTGQPETPAPEDTAANSAVSSAGNGAVSPQEP